MGKLLLLLFVCFTKHWFYLTLLIQKVSHFYAWDSLKLYTCTVKVVCELQDGFANMPAKVFLFSFRFRKWCILVAEEGIFPGCKLQPVGEPLGLVPCRKRGREYFWFCPSQYHPYLSKVFLLMLSADRLLATLCFRLALAFCPSC